MSSEWWRGWSAGFLYGNVLWIISSMIALAIAYRWTR